MCCSSQPAGLLLRGTVPLGPPFYTRRAALRVHVRRCEHVAFAIADKRSPRARPARCETRQAKPLLFPFPAKCPESGPWPVVQWLSGRLAIRARHVARAIGTCPRYSSAPAGRADPLLSRNRKGSVRGGGITDPDGRTGLMESPASGQWAAERCAPEVVCRARTETGAIGTGGPMEGRAVPRAVAVTGARCAVQGGFLRKGRRGGAPRLSRCGGRGTYESDSSLQSGWSAVLRARGTVPPKACSCSPVSCCVYWQTVRG